MLVLLFLNIFFCFLVSLKFKSTTIIKQSLNILDLEEGYVSYFN